MPEFSISLTSILGYKNVSLNFEYLVNILVECCTNVKTNILFNQNDIVLKYGHYDSNTIFLS